MTPGGAERFDDTPQLTPEDDSERDAGAARDLVPEDQDIIASMTMETGIQGVFEVVVDGRTLYAKHETGRHAEPNEVLAWFREQYATGVTPYER